MTRRHLIAVVMTVASLALPSSGAAQQRAADGVAINDEGLPQYSTFSLCAIDPATGQSGASVTTRVPFVGRAVPHVRAGVGAVCTQASTVVEYGPRGLDLLAKGVEPQAVLAQLMADDEARESRQVGVIDMKGRAAAHTGKQNGNSAGSRQGRNYTRDYSQFDEETIAAVDKFRADRNLNYQGNPAGLVDARMIEVLRAAYLEKKKKKKPAEFEAFVFSNALEFEVTGAGTWHSRARAGSG